MRACRSCLIKPLPPAHSPDQRTFEMLPNYFSLFIEYIGGFLFCQASMRGRLRRLRIRFLLPMDAARFPRLRQRRRRHCSCASATRVLGVSSFLSFKRVPSRSNAAKRYCISFFPPDPSKRRAQRSRASCMCALPSRFQCACSSDSAPHGSLRGPACTDRRHPDREAP